MGVSRFVLAVCALSIVSAVGYQAHLSGQTDNIVVRVTSAGDRPINFRGAIMFQEGGLQLLDRQTTPFEVRGRGGVALGVFERLGVGPEIRVELSNGQGSAAGTAGRVIVGNDVVRGLRHFAKTF
jgi:hypothetical protein